MAFAVDELTTRFAAAANHLPTLLPTVKSETLLELYGLYKQATAGKCDTPRPSWYAFEAKQKWEAWNSLGDLPGNLAMLKYIDLITELSPDWESESDAVNGRNAGWVSVSTLGGQDSDRDDDDKDIFDRVKEGDVDKLRQCGEDVNVVDDDGLSPLHWAADRGHADIIKCLIDLGAKVNVLDKSGQTALHYAAACGHEEVVQLLLKNESDPSIKCMDGLLAVDVAENDVIKDILINSST